ncbi:glycosyltransferase family 2 protein [Limosilactobacillus reuteri]|uniref:glycosyltransferase family 2 protein n=1 Tax=Limosilactobacillus reuteri TaxID=1598 RepID=UPI003F969DE1
MDVSIITPMFHGNKYINKISKTIDTVAKNSKGLKIEWIIVNDLPNSIISLPRMLNENLVLHYIENKSNLGIQKSRIKGIRCARGKYILLLDQDDFIDGNILNICLSKIENCDVCIVNGYSETVNGNLTPLFKSKKQMRLVNNINYYFYVGNLIASPGMALIKKDAIPSKWLNSPLKINGADDWLLWVCMLAEKCRFKFIDKKLYVHKKNEENTSDNTQQMLLSSLEAANNFLQKYQNYFNLVKKYKIRLKMRNKYEVQGCNKIVEYIKHPTIAFYLVKLKSYSAKIFN